MNLDQATRELTIVRLENCAEWNARQSMNAGDKAHQLESNHRLAAREDVQATIRDLRKREFRLDLQSFRLFSAAAELRGL